MVRKYAPWLIFFSGFVMLWLTSYPSVGWWSSGHYAACAHTLGIPVQGGSIMYVLLGKLFGIVFFFLPPVKAVILVSITATCLASVFLYKTLLVLFKAFGHEDEWPVIIPAFVTALALPYLYSIWQYAHTADVYSLGVLFTGIILYCAAEIWTAEDERKKRKFFLIAVFFLCIDFVSHRLNLPALLILTVILFVHLRRQLADYRFWLILIGLCAAGLSPHLYLYLRGQSDTVFTQADVSTWANVYMWIKMQIYGCRATILDIFSRRGPFWAYQINHMYLRYLGWNVMGKYGDGASLLYKLAACVPLVLGITGFVYSLVKRFKLWLLLFITFMSYSFLLATYFNVVNNFFREIDRLFLPSFFIFMLWTGIGLYAISRYAVTLLKRKIPVGKGVYASLAVACLLIVPVNLIIGNWHECNRSRFTFPVDYGYNLLASCEKDAILFTNGDNDTYPLWYLQEVEGFRKDVRVVNLSLLNTAECIKQLQEYEPRIPLELSDDFIKNGLNIRKLAEAETLFAGQIPVRLEKNRVLRVQDQMVLKIVNSVNWTRPIYFAVTVNWRNRIGLAGHMRMEGMVSRLLPEKAVPKVDEARLRHNLFNVYKYRNIADPAVYKNEHTKKLLSNYNAGFFQLALRYKNGLNKQNEAIKILKDADTLVGIGWRGYYLMSKIYSEKGEYGNAVEKLNLVLKEKPRDEGVYRELGEYYGKLGKQENAVASYEKALEIDSGMVAAYKGLEQFYLEDKNYKKLVELLSRWVKEIPENEDVGARLLEYRRQDSM